jgi:hypothetical protein
MCNNITKFQYSFGILCERYVGSEVPFAPSTKLYNFFRYDKVERKMSERLFNSPE